MPEYLAPGVFVEEVSFRSKSIEGVSTTTTGFVGPSRYGPVTATPDVVTSLTEFERNHGDGGQLSYAGGLVSHNYLWHAARAFFEEGGRRLYVSRVFRPLAGSYPTDLTQSFAGTGPFDDGHARLQVGTVGDGLRLVARYPGAAGNLRVRFGLKLGPNVLGALRDPDDPARFVPTVSNLHDGDVVWISSAAAFPDSPPVPSSPPASPPPAPDPRTVSQLPLYLARLQADGQWRFLPGGLLPGGMSPPAPGAGLRLDQFDLQSAPGSGDAIRPLRLSLEVLSDDGSRSLASYSGLPLDPAHRSGGVADDVFTLFAARGAGTAAVPIVLVNDGISSGIELLEALDAGVPGLDFGLTPVEWQDAGYGGVLAALRSKLERGIAGTAQLQGGNDGRAPGRAEYEGRAEPTQDYSTGLKQFEDIEDISIVAAPGATWHYEGERVDDVNAVINLLMGHAERMRYRIAIIDPPAGQTIANVRKQRAKLDSKYAALYYPWVTVLDPVTRQRIQLPPSGFVAGIYARNDTERGVWKAPANEVVRGALGFELLINTAQQEVLNPEGINCFRYFEGRGLRLWGARTLSSDPEWKYVNLRRYFAYLERSIDKGTQWAVFEPNGEALWANVRATVRDFLVNEWASGALLGDKPEKAFFVRCDRSTMTQNDLDNGRLICLIGVAPLKPAEFVIFRIGQWTADSQR